MRQLVLGLIVIAFSAAPARADEAEERAIRHLQKLGGSCTRDYARPGDPVTIAVLTNPQTADADLKAFAAMKELRTLQLNDVGISGAGLKHLAACKQLEQLLLGNSDVTDQGMAGIASLASLRELSLIATSVGDRGLEHVGRLTQLRELGLSLTDITDAGLKHLAPLQHLTHLNLDTTAVTDEGLIHLRGLKRLESLTLDGTRVTARGVLDLKKALPNCNIACSANPHTEIAPFPRAVGRPSSPLGVGAGPTPSPIDALSPEQKRLATRIATTRTAEEAWPLYKELWKHNTLPLNRALMRAPEDGVALQAALQMVALSPRQPHNRRFMYGQDNLGATALERFLGSVEGRTGTLPPAWWEESIRKSTISDERAVMPGWPKCPYEGFQLGEMWCAMPVGQSLRPGSNGGLILFCGAESTPIAADLARELLSHGPRYTALKDRERAFIAQPPSLEVSYPLTCVDRKSGKKLWSVKIWSSGMDAGIATGIPFAYATLAQTDDRVIVFGSGNRCFYIEAFDKSTGKNLYRFANNLVYDRRE